jgi:predicted kinase
VELVIFMGLQAAGKTTFYRRRFAASHEHISKDLMRSQPRPARRQAQLIEAALGAGRSVVVDNTNATLEDRAELIRLGRAYGAEIVGYAFESSVAESRKRNSQRTGRARVPDVAIYATAKRFVPPAPAEGFDRLYVVRMAPEGEFACRAWTEAGASSVPATATTLPHADGEERP